uniref:Ti-type conjugative transfer relaxase TraA n=1 Tax=uncultured Sphingomonas sp. TaxID=158754 RepID=UPI0035CC911C
MAIYHFAAKVISRAAGSSALAAAAYRSASRLYDQRLDRHHDFSNKTGVVHSEVMLPDGAPGEWSDREKLWNAVEAAEKRIDAQLAREIEFAIPRELSKEDGIALARDFVRSEFVERGMVADLNVHWDIGADGLAKPHAHVMLTMRDVTEDGFGQKNRDWNRTDLLEKWRERWAEHANQRLAELDIDARIDHRSLEAQGIELEPQHKIGPAAARMAEQGVASERIAEHHDIARANGEKIIANPGIALDAITRNQATFTRRDLAMFVHRHSDGKEQFDQAMAAVRGAPDLLALGKDGRGDERFTSRDMIETEQRLERATLAIANRGEHTVADRYRDTALARAASRGMILSSEQRSAYEHVTEAKGLGVVVGYAGTGKSAMLGVAREAWEGAGYAVRGLALSGIAVENLESGSGIASRTIASIEHQWAQDRDLLSARDVLVIDEAGMIGTRQLERVINEAEKRGAKVVLVGDPEQLQAIEAGAAFRSVAERYGSVEITDIRRQREGWQRDATRQLATGRTAEAVRAYDEAGHVHAAPTRERASADLIDRWDRDRAASPSASRIILTHTNDAVRDLNLAARERLRTAETLGNDVAIATERGCRQFAAGDRIMFLKNERSLGVKNGSIGSVESLTSSRMAVMLDDGRSVAFDIKDYAHVDHGYAATIHKAQGVTVDRVHVLATPGLDRHAAYVALSRHRDRVDLHYGQDDFADHGRLVRTLSRERSKDMASDYTRNFADRREIRTSGPGVESLRPTPTRDLFAGLDIGPAASPLGTPQVKMSEVTAPLREPRVEMSVAVRNYVLAYADIYRTRGEGLEDTPDQQSSFNRASAALNSVRPDGARDLRAAFMRDPRLIEDGVAGNTKTMVTVMDWERRYRQDPELRADVFVQRWQGLERQRRLLLRDRETVRANAIGDRMMDMGKGLERDPQVESILQNRKAQLGLPDAPSRSVGQGLMDLAAVGRSRGRGIGI